MSEHRLDDALRQMRDETVDDATLEAARARVWTGLSGGTAAVQCTEFRPDFSAYLNGTLPAARRLLTDDHLTRCAACRAAMAELKGERRVIAMPQRSSSRLMRTGVRWGALAAAASVLLAIGYASRDPIDRMLAPDGPRATVVSLEGGVYRLPGHTLKAGDAVGDGEIIRTAPGAHAVLRLADGSTVDVNERTELFATAAWSGRSIHLQRGDVVVRAAKQRQGSLRVLTRDSVASVKGTVFAVSAGLGGSVVSVVEGSVAVNQPGRNVLLRPGEQAASNPYLASSVTEAVAWSPSAGEYRELLASFMTIERQVAESFPTEQRTTSALLPYLPPGAFAYGAVPNLGGRFDLAMTLADQQSSENATFQAWWSSETGQSLKRMVSRLQAVSALLGDEIVFTASTPAAGGEVPMVMARVQPGRQAELARALDMLFADSGEPASPYSVSGDLMVVSNTPANLSWSLAHLQQGAGSPFATAIAARYQRGTGWLLAIDAPAVVTMAAGDDAPPVELAAMIGMKYLFVEQRSPAGAEENEVTLMFQGVRKGMGSWLADAGSGGVAEYLPADSLAAGFVAMREPFQLFQEFTALMTEKDGSFQDHLAEVEQTLGSGFIANLTAALGSEAAFSFNGLSVSGPAWTMVALANNATAIDSSLRTFVDAYNAALVPEEQDGRIVFAQEHAGGRTWNTIKGAALPLGVVWTYDAGYMVTASDRATAERALATRHGGSPLVWSPAFLGQLPSSAGMHPSGFAWLNTRGALTAFSTFASTPALTAVLAQRDPVLVVFDGKPEQIHAASRTRLPGLFLDLLLLESLGRK